MLKNKSKFAEISPKQFMLLVFVSRFVVSLTNIQAVSVGKFSPDLLLSLVLAFLLVAVMSYPTVYCINHRENPLANKGVALMYSFYFCFCTAVTIIRFSYFASSKMSPELSFDVFVLLFTIAVCYGAYLGIEGISRLGAFSAVLLVLMLAVVVLFNLNNFDSLNFYPSMLNTRGDVLENAVIFASNTIEPVLMLPLSCRINGNCVKPFFKGIILAFLSVFIIIAFSVGVLGAAGDLQAFPVYTLFQMSSDNISSRFDIIHTSFWILGAFVKCSLLVYCASLFSGDRKNGSKCICFSLLSLVMCLCLYRILGMDMLTPVKNLLVAGTTIFSALIPTIFALTRKEKSK